VEKLIFALDIGTRSVVGLVLENINGDLKLRAYQIEEHQSRSMLDGQIHNVVEVAETINRVKFKLEEKLNTKLKKVAVAAAGRALKTKRAYFTENIEKKVFTDQEEILALELAAVQEAQKQLAFEQKEDNYNKYICVGYSVVNYYLDNDLIGNLIGQKGNSASVEVIATFLPRVVVDSLENSLARSGLQMAALTLEPIAAIHALIPPSMRKLNIALVDIGAGTSDIAITAEGTVIAYGMVPKAGDEITEKLSNEFLLDFPVAEKVKRELREKSEVSFTDILGFSSNLPSEEVIQKILPEVENLGLTIAEKIIELNSKQPQAVMLVGGGSLTPKLAELLARYLNLPVARVAVRGTDAIQQTNINLPKELIGPEFVTPIGIALTSIERPVHFVRIEINEIWHNIFELQNLTIADALLHAGYEIKHLYGKPGLALTVMVNGKLKIIPGELGTAPIIKLNAETAHLQTAIKDGDKITIVRGVDGKNGAGNITDLLKVKGLGVIINNKKEYFPPLILVNGEVKDLNTPLNDRDEIIIKEIETIFDLVERLDLEVTDFQQVEVSYFVNEERRTFFSQNKLVYLNGKLAGLNEKIKENDRIEMEDNPEVFPTIRELLKEHDQDLLNSLAMKVYFNNRPVEIFPFESKISLNNQEVSIDTKILPNGRLVVKQGTEKAIFQDVFRYVEIERNMPKGAQLILKVNGEPAGFNTEIRAGDHLELYWE